MRGGSTSIKKYYEPSRAELRRSSIKSWPRPRIAKWTEAPRSRIGQSAIFPPRPTQRVDSESRRSKIGQSRSPKMCVQTKKVDSQLSSIGPERSVDSRSRRNAAVPASGHRHRWPLPLHCARPSYAQRCRGDSSPLSKEARELQQGLRSPAPVSARSSDRGQTAGRTDGWMDG